jgi:hypothetical protein
MTQSLNSSSHTTKHSTKQNSMGKFYGGDLPTANVALLIALPLLGAFAPNTYATKPGPPKQASISSPRSYPLKHKPSRQPFTKSASAQVGCDRTSRSQPADVGPPRTWSPGNLSYGSAAPLFTWPIANHSHCSQLPTFTCCQFDSCVCLKVIDGHVQIYSRCLR